ncbi:ComEC/Rec2 family competence protein [Rhizobium sp. LjRoot254]|uniref:ComEC/Rec2 family competence protein n=1 Tax=Rhizobium sp. LjRoot254 TaxID=3342297 RepID=UPI003ECD8D19
MVNPNFDGFVGVQTTPFYPDGPDEPSKGALLWGDGVRILSPPAGGHVKVHARGRDGWIKEEALHGGKSLLEVYFIDVGQGDGILIKLPDFRHIMIDGGHPRAKQNTGKSGADFVDWKFAKDYGLTAIVLDAMITSHNDFDHYGGLADLLDASQEQELDAQEISVEAFYHAGISWWMSGSGRTLGAVESNGAKDFHVQLLGDRPSAVAATSGGAGPQLQGEWGKFIEKVVEARRADGQPTPITRMSDQTDYLPGFVPNGGQASIRVLGPVEFTVGGKPALEELGGDSKTTNGNSILLRLDYGRSRILLTGDLNKSSQTSLMEAYAGRRLEFKCDVAKACHHGSEDVSYSFLQAMEPGATVISSGDGEGHDHPRPRIVAASGATGYLTIKRDEIITPLVYSTELARSVSIGHVKSLTLNQGAFPGMTAAAAVAPADIQHVDVHYTETKAGGFTANKEKPLSRTKVVAGLIYGLVNLRTDGETILMATMNEGKGDWAIKTFQSRF